MVSLIWILLLLNILIKLVWYAIHLNKLWHKKFAKSNAAFIGFDVFEFSMHIYI